MGALVQDAPPKMHLGMCIFGAPAQDAPQDAHFRRARPRYTLGCSFWARPPKMHLRMRILGASPQMHFRMCILGAPAKDAP